MFSPHVWPGVGLVVCDYYNSWYATAWQAALIAGFGVPVCSRTNTDSVLYLFLACTRPPDSTRNKYTEDIAYAQERSQSQSQNACNQLMITITDCVQQTGSGRIYWWYWSIIIKIQRLCSRTHLLARFIRLVQSEFLIPSLLPRCVGVYINQTTSSSSDCKFFIAIYNLYFSRAPWVCI
jgi:hypothetical protein